MSHARVDYENAVVDLENQMVDFVDSDAPPSGKITFERFRFADTIIAVSINALYELIKPP